MEAAKRIYCRKTAYRGGSVKKNVLTVLLWIILVGISVLPLFDLLQPGLPITHDGQDHVARIANFYASLSEGNLVPRWAANLNWGYGHPILMFLYPLPSYVASLVHAIGFSFVDSTKIVFALAFIASVFTMYVWASSAWGVAAGLVAAVLYGFMPYRFVDLYVRGAIGEHMAFVFPPLICYGIFRLSKEKNGFASWPFTVIAIGTSLLILSHNALSLMFLPLIGLYAVYVAANDARIRMNLLIISGVAMGFGFLLSAFYWVPGFFEGKYTLRDIVTAGEFSGRFVPWLAFLYSPWNFGGGNDFSKWLGAGQWWVIVMSFFALEKQTKYQRFIAGCILLLFFSLFAMTSNASSVWNTITLLQKFQFPWRVMSVTVFIIAVIGAIVTHIIPEKKKWITAICICVVTIVATFPMWRAKEYKMFAPGYFTGIYNGTTDTGESSPIWSIRFMEKRGETLADLMPNTGAIIPGERTTTSRAYHLVVKETSRFVEHTLYFPGWQVFIDGNVLPIDKLMFQDPTYRGLMTFDLEPGEYDVRFVFTQTKLRMIADYISIGSLVVFMLGIGTIGILWRKK